VDNFALKYIGTDNALHLINALKDKYKDIKINWKGDKLCGIDLLWDYTKWICKLSLQGFIDKLRKRFNLLPVKHPQFAPTNYTQPLFGQKQQFAKNTPISKKLSPKQIKRIQEIVGTILYYWRVKDPIPLIALSSLTT